MAKSQVRASSTTRKVAAFDVGATAKSSGVSAALGTSSASDSYTSVRLLRQVGAASDPIVTLVQLVRSETAELSFAKYQSKVQAQFAKEVDQSWTGPDSYEKLLDITRKFTSKHGVLRFDAATSDSDVKASDTFSDEDAAQASAQFFPDTVTKEQMDDNVESIINGTSTSDTTTSSIPGVLDVTRTRAGQQITSDTEILPNDGEDPWNNFDGVLRERLENFCCVELIWSYWMEQAMLVQGMNAITMRYQNRRPIGADPLARCDISYLRPLSNLLWGYIQKEPDRLSVPRRAYEYDHHYGLRLTGSAISSMQPADSRSRFIGAFHRMLNLASKYYTVSMNTTMQADAYPALHAIKELALLLEEGMHNQYGELPLAARQEMLMQQYFLDRSEIKNFLGGRPNVTYQEPWMAQMDTLRNIMGWNDASIRHYYDLATYGEIILLTIRIWQWSIENRDTVAASWLQALRAEIQGYIHAYRSVTGVDLSNSEVNIGSSTAVIAQPTDLILRRRASLSANGRV